MIADAGCPHAVAMRGFVKLFGWGETVERMPYNLPVDQILGMKDGQARNTVERTGCHVIVVAHHTHVGVAVVGVDYGVGVSAVAIVGTPHFRAILCVCRKGQSQ